MSDVVFRHAGGSANPKFFAPQVSPPPRLPVNLEPFGSGWYAELSYVATPPSWAAELGLPPKAARILGVGFELLFELLQ
jgi:hypothetical protein